MSYHLQPIPGRQHAPTKLAPAQPPRQQQPRQQQPAVPGSHARRTAPPPVMQVQVYNSQGLPKREGVESCAHFVKQGECKFSTTCRFNHPEFIYLGVDFNSQGFPLRPNAIDCEFYLKQRSCKFGCTCQFNHPELPELPGNAQAGGAPDQALNLIPNARAAITNPPQGLNSRGLPLRPGAEPCKFYLQTETCKFGGTCSFDHPEDTTAFTHSMIEQSGVQLNSQGLPLRPGVPTCPHFLKMGECKFGATCKWDHDENAVGVETDRNSMGMPIREGQKVCEFFSKTGQCKFSDNCKFDHPERFCSLAGKSDAKTPFLPALQLNAAGLPLRPGQPLCPFYARTKTCSFTSTCKFDHSEAPKFPPKAPPMTLRVSTTVSAPVIRQPPNLKPRAMPY